MTTTNLYATSHIAGTIGTPANVLDAPNLIFTTDVDNTSFDARFAMGDLPAGENLSGTQTVIVRVRKETGTGTPTLTAEVWENGVFKATLFTSRNITSLVGEDQSGTFSGALISIPNNVEIRLIGTASGGGPSARSTPQIDAITWIAEHNANLGRMKLSTGALKPVKISTGVIKPVKVMTVSGLKTLP